MTNFLKLLTGKDDLSKFDVFTRYLIAKTREHDVPLEGTLELTPRCPLDCKMCYVHLRDDQMSRPELDTQTWISLIDDAYKAGMMYATLTGGECLLHPGFREIYLALIERGVIVTIFTNAVLLNRELVEWLSRNPPEYLQITIYGSDAAGYEEVCGNGKAFDAVNRALALLDEYRLRYKLAITVSKPLYGSIESIYQYCLGQKAIATSFSVDTFKAREGTGRNEEDYAFRLEESSKVKDFVMALQRDYATERSSDAPCLRQECEGQIPQFERCATGIPCNGGRNTFCIAWDGKLQTCNSFDALSADALTEGFPEAWRKVNEQATLYREPRRCNECEYKPYCHRCAAFHYLDTGGFSEPSPKVCEDARWRYRQNADAKLACERREDQ